MRETMGMVSLIFGFVLFVAALTLPLIAWRIKDLLLEIRDELIQARKDRQ